MLLLRGTTTKVVGLEDDTFAISITHCRSLFLSLSSSYFLSGVLAMTATGAVQRERTTNGTARRRKVKIAVVLDVVVVAAVAVAFFFAPRGTTRGDPFSRC